VEHGELGEGGRALRRRRQLAPRSGAAAAGCGPREVASSGGNQRGYPRFVDSTAPTASWTEHTLRTLAGAGYRSSGARSEVIDGLAELGCSVTAREIADLLREKGSGVGLASIYRTLDLLDRLGLVQRFEVGEGVARYEPAHPGGDHHHHIVCDSCGKVEAFEDPALENALTRVERRSGYAVAGHDVVLHGACTDCGD
jgi:Fur family ferric uptake transcriptional regulator